MEARVQDALRRHFRPEFLNRIDETIIFHSLAREQLARIVDIQLARLQRHLAEKRITLELNPAARNLLAEEGYDPVYGARPLKRVIQRRVLDRLATELLEGRIREGDRVRVGASDRNGELTFAAERPTA
jgi:ATP-dependent Clp protease ATP-binding subunit ClpB